MLFNHKKYLKHLSLKQATLLLCLSVSTLFMGCKPFNTDHQSEIKGFIADGKSDNNYIAAFLGDSNGIPGTLQDIGNIARVFNKENGLNFTMPGPDEGGWKHASGELIVQKTADIAKQMLEQDLQSWANLQKGGTLFFYVTSHGARDGTTSTQTGPLEFSRVAKAIRTARNGHPIERLIVMFDTCFSGQNIVGEKYINQNTGYALAEDTEAAEITQSEMDIYIQKIADEAATIKGFYKSAIFIGASRPAETSGDVSTGGVGTQALLKAVNKAKNGDGQATIKQILDDMVQDAYGQTPTYCVYPKSLADDFFFDPPAGYLPTNPINAVMAPEDKICKN